MTHDIDERIEIMQHFRDGGRVEARLKINHNWDVWDVVPEPVWNWNSWDYRKAVAVPISVNWDHVANTIVAFAMDKCGDCYCYAAIPVKRDYYWTGRYYCNASIFASFNPGTIDWEDSLIIRPGYVQEDECDER